MPTCAPRPAILLATAAVGCLLSGAAQAQIQTQAQTAGTAPGPRYMSWGGRPQTTTPANVTAAQAQGQIPADRGMIPRRTAPSQAVSRPMMQPVPSPQPVSRGLTPASAWLGPPPLSSFAPGTPDPLAYTRLATAPAPVAASALVQGPVQNQVQGPVAPTWQPVPPQPEYLPNPDRPTAAALEPVTPSPTAADPMAPRPDAAIFRLRPQGPLASTPRPAPPQPAPEAYAEATPPRAAQPGQQGSRYYSVHRETGQTPDRTPLPEAVFYDSVALDLAEPPDPQTPQRDAQGRLRPPVRDEDPDRP